MDYIRSLMLDCCKEVQNKISLLSIAEWSKATDYGKSDTKVVDEVAEKAVIGFLKNKGFEAIFYTEEAKYVSIHENPKYSVILDPIDGSYNAIAGIPFFSISIAVSKVLNPKVKDVEYGIVYNLCKEEIFEFYKGRAYYNFREIKKEDNFREKTIAVVKIIEEQDFKYIPMFDITRSFGSIALELCYLAINRLDAVINLKKACKTVDIAACAPIVELTGNILELNGKNWREIDTAGSNLDIIAYNPQKIKIKPS